MVGGYHFPHTKQATQQQENLPKLRGFSLAKNAYFDTMHPLIEQGVHFYWGVQLSFSYRNTAMQQNSKRMIPELLGIVLHVVNIAA